MKADSHSGGIYHFYWRRICLVVAALVVGGWLALTAGVWAEIRYWRGFSEVRYPDLVLPWRWDRYRAALGAHYFSAGRAQLAAGQMYSALGYFRASLALAPGNLEGRRLAARSEFLLGYKSDAFALLRTDLPAAAAAGDDAYLKDFFDIAFDLQADDEAFEAGRQLLPPKPDGAVAHQSIALAMATARYNRGHVLEAENILHEWSLQKRPEGEILFALCESGRGLGGQAVRRLDGDLARFADKDDIFVALERLTQEQGRPEATRRYALLREIEEPTSPRARIDLIYADQALGRKMDVGSEVSEYCADFKADAGALAMLSQFAADTGEVDVADRARALAHDGRMPLADFDLRVAQAGIAARDYPRALRAITLVQAEGPFDEGTGGALVSGLRAVALLGDGDPGAEIAYSDFLPVSGRLRPAVGLFLARQLAQEGFARRGGLLLTRVCTEYPRDEPALAELVRSDAAARDRAALSLHVPLLLKMRRPPRDALASALPWLDPARDASLRAEVIESMAESRDAGDQPVERGGHVPHTWLREIGVPYERYGTRRVPRHPNEN
jgi:hypothetical protein